MLPLVTGAWRRIWPFASSIVSALVLLVTTTVMSEAGNAGGAGEATFGTMIRSPAFWNVAPGFSFCSSVGLLWTRSAIASSGVR